MEEKDKTTTLTAEFISPAREPEPLIKLGNGLVAVKKGYSLIDRYVDADEAKRLYDADPVHMIHNIGVDDIASFCELTNEYKDSATKIFYNDSQIRTVFNYHTKGGDPARCDSKIYLNMTYTDTFSEFTKAISRRMGQKDFVRFLKKSERYITSPDGATILEIAQSLSLSKQIDGVEKNTSRAFSINLEVKTGKDTLTIPDKLIFEMRPYFQSLRTASFIVELFIDGGDNGFSVELMPYDLDEQLEQCVNEIIKDITDTTKDVKAFRVADEFPPEHQQSLKPSENGIICNS